MKKPVIISLLIALVFAGCSGDKKTGNNHSEVSNVKNLINFKYSRAIAFATGGSVDYNRYLTTKKIDFHKLPDTISKTLNETQLKYLDELLSGKKNKDTSHEHAVADCFYPRHNVIFLDKEGNIIHYIFVCFECNRIQSSIDGKASMDNYDEFFNSLGLKVFYRGDHHEKYYDSVYQLKKNR